MASSPRKCLFGLSSPKLKNTHTPRGDRDSFLDKENTPVEGTMKTSRNGTPLPTASNGRLKEQFKIISDDEIAAMSRSRETVGKKLKTAKRRSLAPLQQSVEGKNILTGYGRDSQSMKDALLKKKGNIVTENFNSNNNNNNTPSPDLKNVEESDDETAEDSLINDALSLMKSTETVDERYWQSMAEERRLALEETLNENEQLYDEIDKLKAENEKMKDTLRELECYKMLYLSVEEQVNDDQEGDAE